MCIFCLLGLLGCLLALGMPRAGRVLLWIAAFLALLGSAGMAGLFIYGYTPPRSYEFAYSIAGPVALSGLALFVAGLFSRRTQKQPQTPPQQAYSSSPTIPVAQCPRCRQPWRPGAAFCTACGAPAGSSVNAAAGLRCPNPQCGRIASPGSKFCAGCGGRLS